MRSEGARGSEEGGGAVERVVGVIGRSEGAPNDDCRSLHGAALVRVARDTLIQRIHTMFVHLKA